MKRKIAALLLLAFAAGCSGTTSNGAGLPPSTASNIHPSGTSSPPPGAATGAATEAATKVLTIFVENHTYSQMKAGMPYLFSLAERYGYASNWRAITNPSLPNYLAVAAGSTFGITDDNPPSQHHIEADSVFSQALDADKSAKVYAESMPSNCYLDDSELYAVRHNPWTFFSSSRKACETHDVPISAFSTDAVNSRLPNVGMLIPNLCDIAHTGGCPLANAGSLSLADAFLKEQLPQVLGSSDFTSGALTVVVTADEGSRTDNRVLTVVMNAHLSGVVVTSALNHYSLTRYYEEVLGATLLNNAVAAPDMKVAFGL